MPHTVNGIGTHYYGKANPSQRKAECRACGRTGTLTSYDTRLFFVVIFVPLIPLGRKRIIDQCATCKRHYVMPLVTWESQRQLQTSGALDDYRQAPTVENGMAAHAQLMNFRQVTEAAELRVELLHRFPESARLMLHMAESDRAEGNIDGSDGMIRKAFALRPDLPETRFAMAGAERRAGELDAARALLEPLEKPGAAQLYPMVELENLAYAYQDRGRNAQAHEIMSILLRELPEAAQHPGFRKRFARAEQAALPGAASTLPKRDHSVGAIMRDKSRRKYALIAAAVAVIAIGMAARNEFVRRHRTLTVVNGFESPVIVEIEGAERLVVAPGERGTVPVKEGSGLARVTGAVKEEIPFTVETGYFETPTPPQERFVLGERFSTFEDIDRRFEPLPQTMSVKRGQSATQTSLERWKYPVGQMVSLIAQRQGNAAGLAAGESALAAHPDDEELLSAYSGLAINAETLTRVRENLSARLDHRPVLIYRHRAWQDAHLSPEEKAVMRGYYRDKTAAEPENSSLFYLAGRSLGDGKEAMALYEKAKSLDPGNFWPAFILGYLRMEQGRWDEARELLADAVKINPREDRAASALFRARLALGETEALAGELRGTSSRQTDRLILQRSVFAAAGNKEELHRAGQRLIQALRDDGYPPETIRLVSYENHYMADDMEELEKRSTGDTSAAGLRAKLWLQLESGQPVEAEKTTLELDKMRVPAPLLECALAELLAGNESRARSALGLLIKEFIPAGGSNTREAELLQQTAPVTPEQLDEVYIEPQQKAVLCAVLAQLHPDQKPFLLEQARRFNFERAFPYRLVAKAVAAGLPSAP